MPVDILLVNAPSCGIYGFVEAASAHQQPLGLAYVASYIEKEGYTVSILDCDAENISAQTFVEKIISLKPAVLGFTTTTPLISTIIEMAALARKHDPRLIIIAGGAHATALPEETLKRSAIDIVVRGEGEAACADILNAIRHNTPFNAIAGITYRRDDQIISTPDRPLISEISVFPNPAHHLLKMDMYRGGYYLDSYGKRYANIIATRGCPYRCIFCGQDIIFRHTVRVRRAKDIIDELEELYRKYGITTFGFEDSTLTAVPGLVQEICNEIAKRKLKVSWGAMGRANLVDENLYRMMKNAGCVLICYGVESGSQKILDTIKKNVTLDQIRQAIAAAKRCKIPVNTSFIFGLPGETVETMRSSIDFAISLDADFASFSLATPYPGTEFYNIAIKEGTDLSDWEKFRQARYAEPLYVPRGITKEDLVLFHRLAYKKFYMRPGYIVNSLLKIRSLNDFIHKARVGLSITR